MPSPTARTLAWCKAQGFPAAVVEKWNQWSKTRSDLFGFLDILYLDVHRLKTVGVQVTTTDHLSDRRHKIIELRASPLTWLACGNLIELHGWALRGGRGKRKVWVLEKRELTAEDIALDDAELPGFRSVLPPGA